MVLEKRENLVCKVRRMPRKQTPSSQGCPRESPFKTVEEIKEYFDNEKLTCLLCGSDLLP